MTPDRVAEVAQYVRQVDKQQRERPFLGVRKAEDLGSIATKTGLQVAEVRLPAPRMIGAIKPNLDIGVTVGCESR